MSLIAPTPETEPQILTLESLKQAINYRDNIGRKRNQQDSGQNLGQVDVRAALKTLTSRHPHKAPARLPQQPMASSGTGMWQGMWVEPQSKGLNNSTLPNPETLHSRHDAPHYET